MVAENDNPDIVRFDALWIFDSEIDEVSKSERWLDAHISQPLGKPEHKHEGYIEVSKDTIVLREEDNVTQIPKSEITELKVGYDENFRRIRDSRGIIEPMCLSFDDKKVYLFTRKPGDRLFSGQNTILESLILSRDQQQK